MWKKTFIRVLFVMLAVSMGVLMFAAATYKASPENKECSAKEEKCCNKEDGGQGDFIIWESLSRTVISAIEY